VFCVRDFDHELAGRQERRARTNIDLSLMEFKHAFTDGFTTLRRKLLYSLVVSRIQIEP
jgi:hypothetical protein